MDATLWHQSIRPLPRYFISLPLYIFPATNKVTSAFDSKPAHAQCSPNRPRSFPSWCLTPCMCSAATSVEYNTDEGREAWDLVVDTERKKFPTETRRGWTKLIRLNSVSDFGKVDREAEGSKYSIAWDQKSSCALFGYWWNLDSLEIELILEEELMYACHSQSVVRSFAIFKSQKYEQRHVRFKSGTDQRGIALICGVGSLIGFAGSWFVNGVQTCRTIYELDPARGFVTCLLAWMFTGRWFEWQVLMVRNGMICTILRSF